MKKLLKIASLSTAIAMCLSPAHNAQAQTLGERSAEAQLACEEALEENTSESLRKFRQNYGFFRTSCNSLAFNQRPNRLFDVGDKNNNPNDQSSFDGIGGSKETGESTNGVDSGFASGKESDDHPIVEAMRASNTNPISNETLNQLQSILNAAE
mgnify:CR=1 FL=1